MRILVYGGSGSGKSAFAEKRLVRMRNGRPLYYVATMNPEGADARERIRRHREKRRDKGFATVELRVGLAGLVFPERGSVLVECLGNLLANEMFSPGGAGDGAVEAILGGIDAVGRAAENLFVVSNDVVRDGTAHDAVTKRYIDNLAELNRRLAADSDAVVETVCGIPLFLKGKC